MGERVERRIRYGAMSLRDDAVKDLGLDRETAEYLLDFAASDGAERHPWRLAQPLMEREEVIITRIAEWKPSPTPPPVSHGANEVDA